jgi:hypothetical protein
MYKERRFLKERRNNVFFAIQVRHEAMTNSSAQSSVNDNRATDVA